MTLYTSNDPQKGQKVHKMVKAYIGFTLFCGLFSSVYEYFGHGVYSNYMVFLFIFPLLGGALPYYLIGKINAMVFPDRVSMNIYNSGVATLAVGSCLEGVLQIYGTSSGLVNAYWITGLAMSLLGLGMYIRKMTFQIHSDHEQRSI